MNSAGIYNDDNREITIDFFAFQKEIPSNLEIASITPRIEA